MQLLHIGCSSSREEDRKPIKESTDRAEDEDWEEDDEDHEPDNEKSEPESKRNACGEASSLLQHSPVEANEYHFGEKYRRYDINGKVRNSRLESQKSAKTRTEKLGSHPAGGINRREFCSSFQCNKTGEP